MRRKITRTGLTSVQIRPQIAKMMAHFVGMGVSKSELINEALRQYFIERELQELKQKLAPYAQAKGIYTDEDVERTFL